MRHVLLLSAFTVLLAGCSVSDGNAPSLQPIPGSITYNGQPQTRLTKAPVGSPVPHEFRDERGRRVNETYVIQPDRSLKLVSRRVCDFPFCDD